MRSLIVEITGKTARLPGVLSLTVSLLFFVSITEHSVVADPIHLRLVLLPEIEGMRLKMVAHAGAHVLLGFCTFDRSHLVLTS